ncbi:MAG: hypothetical protein R2690_07495 [Acidimicrobiales bacterium]
MGRPDPVDRVGGQRTTPQRRADALVEICRFYGDVNDLDSDDTSTPTPRHRRPRP